MSSYDKEKIKNALDKYLETESPNDFGEFLMALQPIILTIAKRYNSFGYRQNGMPREIMLKLWENQSDVNMLKLLRMKRDKNGVRVCVSGYFCCVIKVHAAKISNHFEAIPEKKRQQSEDMEGYGKVGGFNSYIKSLMNGG